MICSWVGVLTHENMKVYEYGLKYRFVLVKLSKDVLLYASAPRYGIIITSWYGGSFESI